MKEETSTKLSCPNGHDAPSPDGSHFCIQCGERLVPLPAPPDGSQLLWPTAASQRGAASHPRYCDVCGGEGSRLEPSTRVCRQCRWVRPLAPGYAVDASAFQWSQDGAAMARLRSIGPLNTAARAISDKVGRRWVETTFNGIRLSEKQLPEVYSQAVRAAQILGMPYMPEVYVSGDRMWDAMTFGSDNSAFVVLGTALLTNFKGDDLLFLLAREMGHCRAGHALWKTVIRFLIGEQATKKGLMAGGLIHVLNPVHLIEGTLELPLLAWARQAEITADRAGLLAIGDESTARRVLLSWSLKSSMLYKQINVESWLEQQEDADDQVTRLSEIISSSTPYITRRLKLMTEFARSQELEACRTSISKVTQSTAVVRPAPVSSTSEKDSDLRVICSFCHAAMRIPRTAIAATDILNVRCPNERCRRVITLKKQTASSKQSIRPAAAA